MSGKNNREFNKFAGADSKRDLNKPGVDAPLITDLFPSMNPFYGTMKQESYDKFMESNEPLLDDSIKITPQRIEMVRGFIAFHDGLTNDAITADIIRRGKMASEKNNQLSEDV